MEVRIIKPPVTTLWIDTSVIIDIAKVLVGESIQESQRLLNFYETVRRKVREKKLLCPEGDQQEEFEMGKRLVEECHHVQANLAWGIHFAHRAEIEHRQTYRMMQAHIKGEENLDLPYLDAFMNDPIQELNKSKDFKVTVNFNSPDQLIDYGMTKKRAVQARLENLRQTRVSNKTSYQEALEIEYATRLLLAKEVSEYFTKGTALREGVGHEDMLAHAMKIQDDVRIWDSLGGKPAGVAGIVEFWQSQDYKSIPHESINFKLFAKIVTIQRPVESGDSMDTSQLAAVMPYCNFVVTDRRLRARLIELGLDREYGTGIFSQHELNDLTSHLEQLG